MKDHILGNREKAMEEGYFRDQDAKLMRMLRERAALDEIALELGEKLRVDDPGLLLRVKELGVTREIAPAFLLAPLVQVAWAEGKVSKEERETVLVLAGERGVAAGTPSHTQLEAWLQVQPSAEFFDTALEVLAFGFNVLPPAERDERVKSVLRACREVAEASGGIGRLLGLGDGVSGVETSVLDRIARLLRAPD